MKKLYIQPETIVCETLPALMIAASPGVHGGGDASDIGYGGEDDGSHDPGVKGEWSDIWD